MGHVLLKRFFCSTALGLALAFAVPAVAQAPKSYDFAIPKASLGQVLTAIARTGGATFSVPADLVAGRSAGPITGRDTLEGALSKALNGTGLTVERRDDGSFVLRKQQDAAANGAGAPGDVETIDVTDAGGRLNDNGFKAGSSNNVARIGDAPIKEIPLAVTGVTKDTIRSQQAKSVQEIARNVAGVLPQGNGEFNIRGFNVKNADALTYKGNRTGGVTINSNFIERVTVLKGPTSILTGRSSDGGVIDMEPKTADGETHRELTAKYNTQGRKELFLDIGGQLPQTDGLNARLLASGLIDGTGGINNLLERSGSLLPSLSYENDVFRQDMSVSYFKQNYPQRAQYQYRFDYDIRNRTTGVSKPYRFDPQSVQTDRPFTTKAKDIKFDEKQTVKLGELLGSDVEISNRFSYSKYDSTSYSVFKRYVKPNTTYYTDDGVTGFSAASNHLETKITSERDSFKNILTIGYDYSRTTDRTVSASSYPAPDPAYIKYVGIYSKYNSVGNTINKGLIAVDKLDLFDDRLHLLGSIRWDKWTQKSQGYSQIFIPGYPTTQSPIGSNGGDQGKSWTAGAVYDLTDWVSAYINASDGVRAGANLGTGGYGPTQTSEVTEGGFRFNFLDDDLSITTSVFNQEKTGVPTPDPSNPNRMLIVKSQKSKGVELQIDGQVTSNLRTTLGLTYTDATISGLLTDSDSIVSGIPKYAGSLWTVYSFDDSTALSGLSVGFGLHGSAGSEAVLYKNAGEPAHKAKIPAYVIADASVYYEKDNWSVGLKVNNIFDKFAFMPGTGLSSSLIPEERRTAYIEARVKF